MGKVHGCCSLQDPRGWTRSSLRLLRAEYISFRSPAMRADGKEDWRKVPPHHSAMVGRDGRCQGWPGTLLNPILAQPSKEEQVSRALCIRAVGNSASTPLLPLKYLGPEKDRVVFLPRGAKLSLRSARGVSERSQEPAQNTFWCYFYKHLQGQGRKEEVKASKACLCEHAPTCSHTCVCKHALPSAQNAQEVQQDSSIWYSPGVLEYSSHHPQPAHPGRWEL